MREEIDSQLPFIQIHRSVGAKAAQVAAALGITYQHARGGLDIFWEGLADRRILSGKDRVVLSPSNLAIRLRMAFGVPVDIDVLVAAGFLEPVEDAFRVRGMSPYLNAEKGRMSRRGNRDGSGVPPRSHPGATPVPCEKTGSDPGLTPVPPRSHPAEVRGETKEVRVKDNVVEERNLTPIEEAQLAFAEGQGPPVPLPPVPFDRFASGTAFFAWVQNQRVEARFAVEKPPNHRKLSSWFSEFCGELHGDVERGEATLHAWAQDDFWRTRNLPFQGFMSQWRKYVPRKSDQ